MQCASFGANIVAAGIARDALRKTAGEINGSEGEGRAVAVPTDIRSKDEIEALFQAALATYGRLDGAVANAGVIGQKIAAIEMPLADWEAILAVNLTGTFLTVMEAGRILVRQGQGGSIIATGSSSALRTVPGLLGYAASKGGVHVMMQALALELAPHRIRVNTLVPGTTATDAVRALPGYLETVAKALPMGEVVEVGELGRMVAFALSDALPHLTGSLLKVDSGRTIA
jgi:NAD(P)-dependent dehydrogenase (short-subunit alcohol dehydrogenase family)